MVAQFLANQILKMKSIFTIVIALLLTYNCSSQNSALIFDGNSEYVTVPHNDVFNIQTAYTIEAWIFADEWKNLSWQGSIVSKDAQGPDVGYTLRCGDNGVLSFVMSVDNVWNEVLSPPLMSIKQWHHVAAVVNNGVMTLYIDGMDVASKTYSGTPSNNTNNIAIGESSGFSGRLFDGVLDEIRIWNTARTQAQLNDNKTADLSGNESGLVAYYPMNEGTGLAISDMAGSSDGTLINMNQSNWVDGYALPDFDASIGSITGIDRVAMKTRPSRMAVSIQNSGTNPIADIQLTIDIDGEEVIAEIITAEIQAGEALVYEVKTPVDLTGDTNPNITARIAHPEDANSLNNESSITIVTREGNFVNLFDRRQHNFGSAGQNQTNNIMLPADLSRYEQLLLHINVDCPSGGCDPWDQTAKVIANTDDGSYEIARYITPYGIACGNWVVDVTDFKSVLGGSINYNSFVQVWGASGWLVTIDMELVEGTSPKYSNVTPLWQDDYQVYGDPGISYDLESRNVVAQDNTQTSHIRMTISGHGQGNTNNAAEFFNVNHSLVIDGLAVENHNLWKADCAANLCDDQAGNWLFARAGWCPGQQVTPRIFNTTDIITNNGRNVDYQLQEYTNLLNTGYNSSGHTEPHYRIHSFFVENSNSPYRDFKNLETSDLSISLGGLPHSLTHSVTNRSVNQVDDFTMKYYINNVEVGSIAYDGQALESGAIHEQLFEVTGDMLTTGMNTLYAEVIYAGDEDRADDIMGLTINSTSVEDIFLNDGISINPNPSSQGFTATLAPSLLGGQLTILSIDGRVLKTVTITNKEYSDDLELGGTYFLRATHPEGYTATQKLIIIK